MYILHYSHMIAYLSPSFHTSVVTEKISAILAALIICILLVNENTYIFVTLKLFKFMFTIVI